MGYTLKLNGQTVKQVFVVGEHDYRPATIANPFHIINGEEEACTVRLGRIWTGDPDHMPPTPNLEYSFDNSVWTVWQEESAGVRQITVPGESTLYLRGNNPNGFAKSIDNRYRFSCTKPYEIAGNIQSLISVTESYSLPDFAFCGLFMSSEELEQAPDLLLPATVLGRNAYSDMFKFSSLSTAPAVLPAATLTAGYEYFNMFWGTYIDRAPEIMATTLAYASLDNMFYGCDGLSYIKVHFTVWASSDGLRATDEWTFNVASEGDFYKPSALPEQFNPWGSPGRESRIPANWTVYNF